uniref:Uncharacterized protein n=1 Tax=Pseudomonas phage Ghuch01 TaxID=3138535 RepID=A0AAU6W2Y6_9CAUD
MSARDYLGNEITKGCKVVFVETGYRNLKSGMVLEVHPRQVTIVFPDSGQQGQTKRDHSAVVVKP